MTDTITRIRRKETKWEKFCRLLKRDVNRFLMENMAKIVLVGLPLLGMIAGIFIGVKATTCVQSTKRNDYGRHMTFTAYTVRSGDTVWGIAQDLAFLNPEFDSISQYVAAIERANRLEDGEIETGQKIIIPYYINADGINYDEICSKYGIGK